MNDAILVWGTSAINLILALFIFAKNPKFSVNRIFTSFLASLILWTVLNYLADQASSSNLLYTRLTFTAAVFVGLFGYILSNYFPDGRPLNKPTFLKVQLFISAVIAFITLTPSIVASVDKLPNRVELHTGNLYIIYILYIVWIVASVISNFRRKIKTLSAKEQSQVRLLLRGIVLYAAFAAGSNLILPLLIDSWVVSRFGPVFTLLFVGFCTYAIVRHQMLDIRLIVARSVTYVLLLTTLTSLYAFSVFYISESLFSGNLLLTDRVVPILSVLFLAFTTPYLRSGFDRITNRIFYQDAYEAQGLFDELNQVLVSTVDLELMLKSSASVIEKNLKPEFCVFGLKETEYEAQRVIGENAPKFNKDDIDFAKKITPGIDHKVIVADYLEDSDKDLQRRMRKNDVAALVRITSDLGQEGVGYIVLGAKKSGNPYSSQDIRVLETIANSMVIAIDNALRFEEIQKFNITLEQKVEDATRKLQKANDKLIALDQTKDDFISMASHQLRTPLTSVKGYLSMVLEGDAGKVNPRQEKLLDQAFVSSQRMVYLIADLLNVSRLRTGKFVIEPAEVDLSVIVDEEVKQLQETAQAKNLKLEYKKPKNFPVLMLDETKIRQVAMNFIDNAIYYTPSGGKITVELKDTGKTVEYTVKDSGIGVPKHEQHNLFTKFFRAKNARKARPDGTGLGLFMAKKVVVAQGGAVLFSSQEGKGSTFGFTFDKAKLQVKK